MLIKLIDGENTIQRKFTLQPQCCSALMLSPLPEKRDESIVRENVNEWNKINVLGEADLVCDPLWKSKLSMQWRSHLISWAFPLVFNGIWLLYSQPIGSLGLISLYLSSSSSSNITYINSIFWDMGFFSRSQVRAWSDYGGILVHICLSYRRILSEDGFGDWLPFSSSRHDIGFG